MINNNIKQAISVVMAIMVLISTLSISIEKHYCGDTLVDIAIFTDLQKCGSESAYDGLESPNKETILTAESCCNDVVALVKGQDELSIANTDILSSLQKVFLLNFIYVLGGLHDPKLHKNPPSKNYPKPIFTKDVHVLNEVFLI